METNYIKIGKYLYTILLGMLAPFDVLSRLEGAEQEGREARGETGWMNGGRSRESRGHRGESGVGKAKWGKLKVRRTGTGEQRSGYMRQ